MKLAVITDSSAYLDSKVIENEHLFILDIPVSIDGVEYIEGKNLSASEFYQKMAASSELPKTSQPSIASLVNTLSLVEGQGYTHVIGLFLSRGISGFYQNIQYLKDEFPSLEIAFPDSKITSAPLGMMVEHILNWAEQGLAFEQILSNLDVQIKGIGGFIMVDDLNHLVKGGRLSNGAAILGNLLSIKPILYFNDEGGIEVYEKIRTEKKATKMGQAAYNMVTEDPALELVGLLDPLTPEKEVAGVPVFNQKEDLSGIEADVWVDFTTPKVAYENTRFALEHGFAPVVGTTGFTSDEIKDLVEFSRQKELGGLIAPNFAVGAVLLMQFATQAAKYFPDVEIIELHHDQKKDAPSGTAIKTAELISKVRPKKHQGAMDEKELLQGARGAEMDGMRIHSVRLPGLVAHQEVIFGGQGEGLTLRHDSYDRKSFMTGVNLGIKEVVKKKELVYGLEYLL